MRRILTPIFLLLACISAHGQHPGGLQPEYNPTVPRLISMRHKAVSFITEQGKPTIEDLKQRRDKEDIIVYVVYETDSTIGKRIDNKEHLYPPKKLMDLYLIYDYTYKIYSETKEPVNERIPKIDLSAGGFIEALTIATYFIDDKGKLKAKKMKKAAITSQIQNGVLSIKLDENELSGNSLTEINVRVKTRHFNKLIPSISDLQNFDKSLTISYPAIFKYKIPLNNRLETAARSASEFELLNFKRNSGPGNGDIGKIKVDTNIYSWKVLSEGSPVEFELEGLNFPPNLDIGITPTNIIRLN